MWSAAFINPLMNSWSEPSKCSTKKKRYSQAIHEKIERAFGQFERGEGLTPEESRALLQEKKAAWHKQQQA